MNDKSLIFVANMGHLFYLKYKNPTFHYTVIIIDKNILVNALLWFVLTTLHMIYTVYNWPS